MSCNICYFLWHSKYHRLDLQRSKGRTVTTELQNENHISLSWSAFSIKAKLQKQGAKLKGLNFLYIFSMKALAFINCHTSIGYILLAKSHKSELEYFIISEKQNTKFDKMMSLWNILSGSKAKPYVLFLGESFWINQWCSEFTKVDDPSPLRLMVVLSNFFKWKQKE